MNWLKRTGTLGSSLIRFLEPNYFLMTSVNYTCQEEINFWRKEKNNETYAIFIDGNFTQSPLHVAPVENNSLRRNILTLY